jgi:hypothetical protein
MLGVDVVNTPLRWISPGECRTPLRWIRPGESRISSHYGVDGLVPARAGFFRSLRTGPAWPGFHVIARRPLQTGSAGWSAHLEDHRKEHTAGFFRGAVDYSQGPSGVCGL